MRPSILGGVVAALFLLPGCSAAAPLAPSASVPATSAAASPSAPEVAAEQSALDACASLVAPMGEATTTLNDSMELFASDPKKAVAALESFSTTLESAVAKVTNAEVRAQGDKAVAALKELNGVLDDMIKKPADAKPEEITGALTKMSTELTAIGTVCGA